MVPTAFKSEFKQTEYLVEWKNNENALLTNNSEDFKVDTWEPTQHLLNCNALIQKWEQQTKRQ